MCTCEYSRSPLPFSLHICRMIMCFSFQLFPIHYFLNYWLLGMSLSLVPSLITHSRAARQSSRGVFSSSSLPSPQAPSLLLFFWCLLSVSFRAVPYYNYVSVFKPHLHLNWCPWQWGDERSRGRTVHPGGCVIRSSATGDVGELVMKWAWFHSSNNDNNNYYYRISDCNQIHTHEELENIKPSKLSQATVPSEGVVKVNTYSAYRTAQIFCGL